MRTEEPGTMQSTGLQRVGYDLANEQQQTRIQLLVLIKSIFSFKYSSKNIYYMQTKIQISLKSKIKNRCIRPAIILLELSITKSHGSFKHFGKNSLVLHLTTF